MRENKIPMNDCHRSCSFLNEVCVCVCVTSILFSFYFSYSIILSVICYFFPQESKITNWNMYQLMAIHFICERVTHDYNKYWLLQLCLLIKERTSTWLVSWTTTKIEENMLSTASHITARTKYMWLRKMLLKVEKCANAKAKEREW